MRRRERNKKKRLVSNILLVLLLLLIAIGGFVAGSMFLEYRSDGWGVGETVTIEIQKGEGAWDIAGKLKEEGLIKYRSVFYLKARNMGATGKLKYGTFTLYKDAGLQAIIEDLISGGAQKEETMFTIPEGFSIEQIAKKLDAEGIFTETEFLQAAQKEYGGWFLESVPESADVKYKLQGFLFPDTYAIGDDMTAEDFIQVMLGQFNEKFTKDMQDQAKRLGKTVYEVVIEASIIERETMIDSEREMVAGVIKNRLEKGMRLEMCPTVLYPLTNGIYDKTTVSNQDTEIDSPYNTYENPGLPVGPIANPGLLSMKAALHPAEHEFLFYHTDNEKNDGSHIFTKTYREHTNTQ